MKGVGMGLVLGLLIAAATGGAGWGWLRWVRGRHPELGSLQGSAFHSEGWYVLALAAAAVTITALLLALARRWFSAAELTLGAVVLPFAGAVALTIYMPLAAMNLQWPLLAALLAVGLLLGFSPTRESGTVATVLVVLLAAPVLVFLVPLLELVWLAASFTQALAVGVAISLALMLMLPALDRTRPSWWFAPLVGALATAAFLGIGLTKTRPSADRPAPSTLLFAMDRATGAAQWATAAADSSAPGATWAEAQVGAFQTDGTLEEFLWRPGAYRLKPAQVVAVPEPGVTLVSDQVVDGRRIVRVAVRSELGAEMLLLRLPENPALVAVGGTPVPSRNTQGEAVDATIRTLEHWGAPVDGGLTLDFEVGTGAGPGASVLELAVVEHLMRPEEILGSDPWRRPPDMAPDVTRLSDRALIRTVVVLELATVAVAPVGGDSDGDEAVEVGPDVGTEAVGANADSAEADTTVVVPPDTTGVTPDTTGVTPDTTATPPDSTATPPDSTGVASRIRDV